MIRADQTWHGLSACVVPGCEASGVAASTVGRTCRAAGAGRKRRGRAFQGRTLWLIVCIAFVTAGGVAAQTLAPEEHLQFADGLYARQMYDVALAEYTQFIKANPASKSGAAVYFRIGECQRKLKNPPAAEKAYHRVYAKYPQSTFIHRALFRRAEIFLDAGMDAAAVDLLGKLIAAKPPAEIAPAAHYLRGEALQKIGDPEEAHKAFKAVVDTYSTSPFAAYALIKLGQTSGANTKQAIEHFTKAIKAATTDRLAAEAWFQLAEVHFRARAYEESARAYEQLLKMYPKDTRAAEAQLQATWAFHNTGLYAEALRRAADAEKRKYDDGARDEWLYVRANSERLLLKYAAAVKSYQALLTDTPNSAYAQAAAYEQALVYHRKRDHAAAITRLKQVTWTEKFQRDVFWLLAESHAALDQQDDAIQYYRKLVEEHAEDKLALDGRYRLAHLLQTRGQFGAAAAQYRILVEKHPTSELAPRALFAAGYCLAREGEHAKAVRDWARVIKNHAKNPIVEQALFQKAMSEVRLERDKDGQATLRLLLKGYPATKHLADARFWLGVLLKDAANFKEAEGELRAAVKLAEDPDLKRKAQFQLALTLQKLNKQAEAADLLQVLLASPMQDRFTPSLLQWVALQRLETKKYAAAAGVAMQLVENADDKRWKLIGWSLAGKAYDALGDAPKAIEAYKKSMASGIQAPHTAETSLRLGELLMSVATPEKADDGRFAAEVYLERAAKLASQDGQLAIRAAAYAGLGRAAQAREANDEAARYFMSVALLFDDAQLVPECLHRAAACYAAVGNEAAAKKAIEDLVARYPKSKWVPKAEGG